MSIGLIALLDDIAAIADRTYVLENGALRAG